MIKTLKDLNQAGRRFWSGANAKTKDAVPPGMEKCPNCGGFGRKYGETCSVCHGKGFVPEGSDFGTDDDHHTFVPGGPDGTCKICKQRYDSPIHSDQTGSQRQKDFSTTPAEIEAAAKKAKAAGKSKEEFVAGYSGGAAETAARVWAKDASGLAQEIKDILSKEGPMRLQGLRSELEANGWDVNQDNILMELRAIGAKQKYVQGLGNTWSIS